MKHTIIIGGLLALSGLSGCEIKGAGVGIHDVPEGGECETDDDCIDGSCKSGNVCRTCGDLIDSCVIDSDCCSGYCNGDYCEDDACGDDYASCDEDSDCCGGACIDGLCDESGSSSCSEVFCDSDSDCCSDFCNDGFCE